MSEMDNGMENMEEKVPAAEGMEENTEEAPKNEETPAEGGEAQM